jgi:hypothetical protein
MCSSSEDEMPSSSDDEMPSTSKNESSSPPLELCATITSIEGVPNLPTMSSSSIMVAGRKNNEGNVELLFENGENMTQVVGVGLEWAKVVITKKLDVEVRHIGEHAWQDLWANLKMADFELMNISLSELQTQDEGPSNIRLEDLTERFGVGLTCSDVISVYMEDQVGQSNDEGFAPLVLNLAECMGMEEANVTKRRPVSGGEGESSKGAAGRGSSKEASTGTKDPLQDPPEGPPQDPAWNPPDDQDQDPPNPPEDPADDPAEDPLEPLENKKVHVVTIYPEYGFVHQGSHVLQQDNPINEACIVPILRFEFELRGDHKKITTTLKTQCNLGEGGVLNGTPSNLGYFQDNITVSLTCEKARAATLSSPKVEDVKVIKRTITNNISTSAAREGSGQVALAWFQLGGSCGGTTETGYSTAHEMEIECLGGGFCVHSMNLAGSLAYNFSYPKVMKDIIADHHHGRTELLDLKIGDTVWPTIIGEWDALDMSKKCRYNFKTRRDITSITGLRQSRGNGEEPQSILQQYEVPLWVNHAMTHILHRDDTIQAPGRVRKVIGAKTALHGPRT